VVIRELEPADSVEAVRDGRCHLALSFAYNLVPRPVVAGLVSVELMEEPVLLALPETWRSKRDPIDLKHLAQEDWIVGSRQTDDRRLAERACAAAGFAPRMTHSVDDYDLLLRMVSAGLGIGLVPELALGLPSARSVVVRRPGGTPLRRQIIALTRSALAASPAVRALLSELAGAAERSAGPSRRADRGSNRASRRSSVPQR
jgi:DNA-binding transcriptional LysR family regulator